MARRRRVDRDDDGWDWWGTMQWPPHLREFDSGLPSWEAFVSARKAAAPWGWRLAYVQRMCGRT